MDYVELRIELSRRLSAGQEKYDYWLMAVAASAIALSLHETSESALRYSQIPLGTAMLAWGISFFAGCRRQTWIQEALHTNDARLRIEGGMDPLTGKDPEKIAFGLQIIDSTHEDQNLKGKKWAHVQFRALGVGALFYISWHILEMWLKTGPSVP